MRLTILLLFFFLFSNINCWTQNEFGGSLHLRKYLLENSLSETKVGLFVKGNSNHIIALTKQYEGIYRGAVKGWHYVRIPSYNLKNFAEDKKIIAVNFRTYKGVALNDTMRVNNRINDIHAGIAPLSSSLTGEDVIIGLIDTGIDFLHPDFMNPDSSTRILYIWDQTKPTNQYTPSYGYGQHWDSTEINQGLCTNNDQWGHGSTVSGTAAGNGFANGKNKGVAPKSDIIMVETNFNASDWLATVVDAVEYIYSIADSLGKPCVINASVGTYEGSHDGLDPYALYIDSLINMKSGHLFVAAAGNSGSWGPYHLHTDVIDTSMTWFKVNGNNILFDIWADTINFNNIQFSIGADKVSPSHSFRGRGNYYNIQGSLNSTINDTIKNSNNDILGTIVYSLESRDAQCVVNVDISILDSTQLYFRLETTGTGSFDLWSTPILGSAEIVNQPDTVIGFSELNKYVSSDTLQTIVSSFQCSPYTITVANYSNDSGYVNKYNGWTPAPTETRGALSSTSSKGPTRNGLLKPEIAASGAVTNSSYPLFLIDYFVANNLDTALALGGMHYRNGGTSMASPVVAGVAALFLENCPQAIPQDFHSALINNAYTDTYTGTTPNYAFGYGKLDGFATLVDAHFTPTFSGNNPFCEGDSILIAINGTNASYLWATGETSVSNYFSDSLDTYFIATDSTGCTSDTAFLSITPTPNPILNCLTNSYDFCENYSIEVTETGIFNSVLWSDGNNMNPRLFTQSFNGYVLGLDTNSCISDTCLVVVNERPNPSQPTITNNNNALYSTFGHLSYQWYLDGLLISSANDSIYTPIENGNYQVEVFNEYGCSAFSSIYTISNVSIGEEFINSITISPNPNNGQFVFESYDSNCTLQLFSSDGKLISKYNVLSQTKHYFDIKASGTYYLSINNNKQRIIKKIVVLK